MGDAVRLRLPRPHERATDGWPPSASSRVEIGVVATAGRAVRRAARRRGPAGRPPRVWTAWNARQAARARPSWRASSNAWMHGRRRARRRRPGRHSRSSARAARARGRRRAPSRASAPPSMARPFWLPWQVNGTAPAAMRRAQARGTVGSPGIARARARRRSSRAPSVARRATTAGSASGGMKTSSVAAGGARPRPPRRARRCRSSRWPAALAGSPAAERPRPRAARAGSPSGGAPCASRTRCRSRP